MTKGFLIVFLVVLVACKDSGGPQSPTTTPGKTPGTETNATGGSDGGGGNAGESSEEEIKAAIKKAVEYMKDPRWQKFNNDSLIVPGHFQKLTSKDVASNNQYYLMNYLLDPRKGYFPLNVDRSVCDDEFFCDFMLFDVNIKIYEDRITVPNASYIDKAFDSIRYERDGFCDADDKDDADASVSSHDLRATLCFSLDSLKRVPPKSIERIVLGLWIHELAHMHGYREETAKTMQDMAMKAYLFLSTDRKEAIAGLADLKIKKLRSSYGGLKSDLASLHVYLVNNEANISSIPTAMNLYKKLLKGLGEVKSQVEDVLLYMEIYPTEVNCMPYAYIPDYDPFYSTDPHGSFEGNLMRLLEEIEYYEDYLAPHLLDLDIEDPELSQFEINNIFDFDSCRKSGVKK